MPIRPCPECLQPAPRWLEASSHDSVVNYYRCAECGHVFTIPKDAPNGPHNDVTPPRALTR